jgi:hypothetical protein
VLCVTVNDVATSVKGDIHGCSSTTARTSFVTRLIFPNKASTISKIKYKEVQGLYSHGSWPSRCEIIACLRDIEVVQFIHIRRLRVCLGFADRFQKSSDFREYFTSRIQYRIVSTLSS